MRKKTNPFQLDFVGIGAEKSGTYWIAECLKEHPEVCFATNKEVYFFNDVDPHLLKVENPKYKRGIQWYKRQFPTCTLSMKRGEWTPTYMFTEKTAQRIKKHFPDTKILISLRNPVKRAFSQYIHDKRIGMIKDISFEQALEENDTYIKKGYYYKHLKPYYKLFPKKNIKVIIFEEFKDNPEKHLRSIHKFIGLKDSNYKPRSLSTKINEGGTAKWPMINFLLIQTEYFLKSHKLDTILRVLEKTGVRKLAFNFSYYVNRKNYTPDNYPRMKKETKDRLEKLYKADIRKLSKLLGRNLNVWNS